MAVMTALAIAGAAAAAKGYSDHKKSKAQNKYLQKASDQFTPQNIMDRIRLMNPQLYNAAYGPSQFGPPPPNMNQSQWLDYQAGLNKQVQQNPMAALFQQPGYIDPRMMNLDINQGAQQGQMNAQQFAAQAGRGGFEGGLADAYALANQAAQNQIRAQVAQNYNLARTQLMRQDIGQGQDILNQAQSQATGQASQKAGYMSQMQAPTSWGEIAANTASSALGAYSRMKNIGGYGSGGAGQAAMSGPLAPSYSSQQNMQKFIPPSANTRSISSWRVG